MALPLIPIAIGAGSVAFLPQLKNFFSGTKKSPESVEVSAVPSPTTLAYYAVLALGVYWVYQKAMKA